MEFDKDSIPCSFDVSLCDGWAEKLSVILADGPLNAFTIKMAGEKYGKADVLTKSKEIAVGRSIGRDVTKNFFKILIWRYKTETRCSLYLRHNSPISEKDSPIHERVIDISQFSHDFTRIHLKLWNAGIVKLFDLEVSEVPGN